MIVDEELLINKELLCTWKFWLFATGIKQVTLVEFKDDLKAEFRFKSRKSEMINVGVVIK
jgi:hypothetical protein